MLAVLFFHAAQDTVGFLGLQRPYRSPMFTDADTLTDDVEEHKNTVITVAVEVIARGNSTNV